MSPALLNAEHESVEGASSVAWLCLLLFSRRACWGSSCWMASQPHGRVSAPCDHTSRACTIAMPL